MSSVALNLAQKRADLSAGLVVQKAARVIHENFVNSQSQHTIQRVLMKVVYSEAPPTEVIHGEEKLEKDTKRF